MHREGEVCVLSVIQKEIVLQTTADETHRGGQNSPCTYARGLKGKHEHSHGEDWKPSEKNI